MSQQYAGIEGDGRPRDDGMAEASDGRAARKRRGLGAWWPLLLLAGALPAHAQFKIDSSFRNNTEANWAITGTNNTGNNDSGILTGGYGSVAATATNDANGSGWLRLTTDSGNQVGRALYTGGSFTSGAGVIAEFDYISWGGTGADGLSMFLYDASQNMAGAANGAGLGYCDGAGGYLGVGLDEFGNFSAGSGAANFCNTGPAGPRADRVVVRGPQNAAGGANPVVGSATFAGLDSPNVTTRPTPRRVRLLLIPNGTGGFRVSVLIGPTGGALATVLDALNFPYAAPANLRFGFGASTGGSTNIHEVRNAVVSSPADIVVGKTVSSATVLRGQPVTYTVTVRNNDINTTDAGDQSPPINSANAPDISDPFPTQLTDVSWTCAATAGSTCPAGSGTGSLNFAGGYTLASGGQLTFTVTGTVAGTATCGGTVGNTATADFSATDGYSDINTANNSATADFTVACPRLVVRKTSQNGTGNFTFSGNNGVQSHSIATATAGTPVSGVTQTLTLAGTATTITEAVPPVGYALTDVVCTGMGTDGLASVDLPNRQVLLSAAATNTAGPITCTFTNTRAPQADLSITKTNTFAPGQPSDLAGDTALSGSSRTYTLVITNSGPDAVTGARVHDAPQAGITCANTNPVTITGDGVPAGGFTIADLTGSAGIALGTLNSGQSTMLSFQCTVN
ncbi:MAG: DUF11 domain-containing protein [Lysobacter sp.]|nr:DUF11 domain-containing protein [Lysobacter sp.]